MSQQASCPSCGALLTFTVGTSLVAVCPHCKSTIGRGDRGLETLGKVADLVQSLSPLDVGVRGSFGGVGFELVGRTQFRHPAGGLWDEWYAAFADGKWGWLAEAMGRFFLTFEVPAPAGLPAFGELTLGQALELEGVPLRVAEKNTAAVGGMLGEMPRRVAPGAEHPFADLSGPRATFGTLDYGGPKPAAFLGREVTLDELGIPVRARRTYPGQEPKVAAVKLNCPNCGGGLELRAPDRSERVGCPYCGSLLDVKEERLELLQSLRQPPVEPVIPLGAVGSYRGVEWACLGFLQRSVRLEGVDYSWEEYLLYQPRHGFRWLTRSDGHWNWVEAIPPGSVLGEGKYVSYAGRTFTLFQKATARVTLVYGEFYWKVEAGEEVQSADFVAAPFGLSLETAATGDGGEVNWSHATYMEPAEVRAMFALPAPLPAPERIGPIQPFPHAPVYPTFAALAALLVLIALAWWVLSPNRLTFDERFALPAIPKEQAEKVQPFDRDVVWLNRNAQLTLVPEGAGWVGVRGMLWTDGAVAEPGASAAATPPAHKKFSFYAAGGSPQHVYLSAVPAGRYHLSLTFVRQDPDAPAAATFRVRQGVAHLSPVAVTLLLLALVPAAVGLYQLVWESRRWADSNVT